MKKYLNAGVWVMSKWISVKDRLPEKEGCYLVSGINPHTNEKYVHFVKYRNKGRCGEIKLKWSYTGYFSVCMTHWMPLPPPPPKE